MRDRQTWVFVEVRYRSNDRFGAAAETVTHHKQRRVLHAAAIWLAQRGESLDTANCRFDILAITDEHYEWLPNAFNGQGLFS